VGEVDIVVNNTGYFPNLSIDELDLATWRKTFATNLDSHFLSAKYFLPTMRKKKWGRFIGISSNMAIADQRVSGVATGADQRKRGSNG
jgi:3-oxoacyl-[acyl-carrier protein] reductase